jgi:hypothetical protein
MVRQSDQALMETRRLRHQKIVGCAMRDHMRVELAASALEMAIQRQLPD